MSQLLNLRRRAVQRPPSRCEGGARIGEARGHEGVKEDICKIAGQWERSDLEGSCLKPTLQLDIPVSFAVAVNIGEGTECSANDSEKHIAVDRLPRRNDVA